MFPSSARYDWLRQRDLSEDRARVDDIKLAFKFLLLNFGKCGSNYNTEQISLALPKGLFNNTNITYEECKNVLDSFQNNKSPGIDGFTVEFYKFFYDLLGNDLLSC